MLARLDSQDHFALLGVDRDATAEQVKARYVALAKRWHADVYAGIDLGDSQRDLEAIFKRIAEAHATLVDPQSRAEYITLIDRRRAGLTTDVDAVLRAEGRVDEGLVELARGRWSAAKEAFEDAVQLNPDDPLIRSHLAWARYRAAEGTSEAARKAQADLEKAFKTQANLPDAYRYLGTIAFEHEQLGRAIKWLEKCLEWAPKDVDAARLIRLARSRQSRQQSNGLGALFNKWFGKR